MTANFGGYIPSWHWQHTRARLGARRTISLFGESEQYLTDDEDDDEDADEAPDFQWWDGTAKEPDEDFTVPSDAAGLDSSMHEPEAQEGGRIAQGTSTSGPGEDSAESLPHHDACPTCGRGYDDASSRPAQKPTTGTPLADSVLRIIQAITDEGLTLGRFLAALSWGDPSCISNERIKNVRSSFMGSVQLPELLRTWWKPPRSSKSHKSRPRGARVVMEAFAKEVVEAIAHEELGAIDPLLRASHDHLSKEDLTKTDLDVLEGEMRMRAPTIWTLLSNLCKTPQQLKDNMVKNTGKVRKSITVTIVWYNCHGAECVYSACSCHDFHALLHPIAAL